MVDQRINSREFQILNRQPYAIYVPQSVEGGEQITLNLGSSEREFEVRWFDPKNGGELQIGSVTEFKLKSGNAAKQSLGQPPEAGAQEWVVLVKARY